MSDETRCDVGLAAGLAAALVMVVFMFLGMGYGVGVSFLTAMALLAWSYPAARRLDRKDNR